ncbi:MAG TPA: hypothetical protein VEU95_11910, partial [Micropepsaceae bacterium]|nr:hypothetical protein [Micropepsaceae bacterium]
PTLYRRNENRSGPAQMPVQVLVTMGASDPRDFTRLALKAAMRMTMPARLRFIIGPNFVNPRGLADEIETAGFEAIGNVADLAAEFARADLALISFGVTAYEMAALGVPSLYLALSEDHERSASAFCQAGMGDIVAPDVDGIASALGRLIEDRDRRRAMSEAGRTMIDGQGAARIAAELAADCSEAKPR